ncbi:MAG: two-component regulator propeller domain-containing protein [Planctomycetota bacterium]
MNKESYLTSLVFLFFVNCAFSQQPTANNEGSDSAKNQTVENGRLIFSTGVRTIFQSRDGDYWFGSQDEGLCRHHGKSFKYFTVEHGLPSNQIISIQEDREGNIWVGTLNGVSRFTGEEFELVPPTQIGFYPLGLSTPTRNKWEKRETDLWFNAGSQQGVYKYDGLRLDYLPFPTALLPDTDNTYSVTGFSQGKDGMLWIATYAGVFGFDGTNFTTINDKTLGFTRSEGRLHVRSILEDSKGRLWIGNNGIGVVQKQGDTVSNFSREHNKLMPMQEFRANTLAKRFTSNVGLQSVFAIAEDSEGNIWFGDRDTGAWRYDDTALVNYAIDPNLESNMIWDIYEDHNQNLLFATTSGVYEFNGKSFERKFESLRPSRYNPCRH